MSSGHAKAAMEDLRAKRQHLQSFLLRHGRRYPGMRSWTQVQVRAGCPILSLHTRLNTLFSTNNARRSKMPRRGLSAWSSRLRNWSHPGRWRQ